MNPAQVDRDSFGNGPCPGHPPPDPNKLGSSRPIWPWAWLVFAIALGVRCLFLTVPGFPADQAQFVSWAEECRSSGLAGVYAARRPGSNRRLCNYPPAYIYVLHSLGTAYAHLAPPDAPPDGALGPAVLRGEDTAAVRLAIALHKVPAIVADAILGAMLVVWLGRRAGRGWATLVGLTYVLMPAVIHDSAVWGQVDAIPTVLVVASLEMARLRRVPWMVALAMLAVLVKAQAVIVLPIWVVVAVSWAGWDWRRWLTAVGTAMLVAFVVLLPFVGFLGGVWEAYTLAAGYYPYLHLNGFSAWFLGNPLMEPHLADLRFYVRDDVAGYLGIKPRVLGLVCVLGVWIAASVVMLRRKVDERSLLWAARLLPLAFFVLSTQMHERYLLPAIGLWAWAFVNTRRWWGCWMLLGLCAWINILWVWPGPGDGAWVEWCQAVLHRSWLGLAGGVWCTLAMIALFVSAITMRQVDDAQPA